MTGPGDEIRVAVVGGGITGLAAAWGLVSTPGVAVTVFEPDRVGGKLQTSEFAGRPVDEGPDAFLVRTPEAVQLCSEIGLDDLVAPAAGRTLLLSGGRLRPIPEGLVLGIPNRLGPIMRSGLLTPLGMLRAGLDLVLPRPVIGTDVSVGSLVSGRFGHQVADVLVEPLLGGIHAAPLDQLSTAVVAPHVLSAARSSRSLLLGLRRGSGAAAPDGPIFLAPRLGMGTLVDRLEKALRDRGVEFRPDAVARIDADATGARIATMKGSPEGAENFDAAVVSVPAPAAARVLGPAAPTGLADIPFTSVAVLTVAVPRAQWSPPAGYNGFLVAAADRRLMTACSFFSNKWPYEPAAHDDVILRLSAGRHGDLRVGELADDEIIDSLISELRDAVGAAVHPRDARLSRWPASFPLYRVGHAEAVRAMELEVSDRTAGRIALAGSSYGGAGIPACIRSGRRAAESVLAPLHR